MSTRPRTPRSVLALTRAATRSLRTGGEIGEAALATLGVLGRRAEILRAAAEEPLRADHVELVRMGTEKMAAGGLAALAGFEAVARAQRTFLRYWEVEVAAGARTLQRLARCTTPAAAANLQIDAAGSALQRLANLAAGMSAAAATATGAALSPYHRRVTGNARRLSRRAAV